jgi:hypothetical protein
MLLGEKVNDFDIYLRNHDTALKVAHPEGRAQGKSQGRTAHMGRRLRIPTKAATYSNLIAATIPI